MIGNKSSFTSIFFKLSHCDNYTFVKGLCCAYQYALLTNKICFAYKYSLIVW